MRAILCAAAAGFLLGGAAGARADDQADARAVIEKAVKARGGEERLGKHKAIAWKGKGKVYGLGEGLEYSGDWQFQPPDRFRVDIDLEINGMKIRMARVLTGDKGWVKLNDEVNDLAGEELEEERHGVYLNTVSQLLPLLKDKEFQLSPLGESKVGDRPAVGVKVSRKDRRDVGLFFDKETHLLLKTEAKIKDLMAGGAEVTQETLYSEYKDADGVQTARKVVIRRDGKNFADLEGIEYRWLDKIDDAALAKP